MVQKSTILNLSEQKEVYRQGPGFNLVHRVIHDF